MLHLPPFYFDRKTLSHLLESERHYWAQLQDLDRFFVQPLWKVASESRVSPTDLSGTASPNWSRSILSRNKRGSDGFITASLGGKLFVTEEEISGMFSHTDQMVNYS